MVLAFQLILPSVSKLIAFSRGFSCDNLQVVFLPLFFLGRYTSLKFKGEITRKINSSTKQKQQRPKGCWRVKRNMKFNHRRIFFSSEEGRRASLNILQVTPPTQLQLGSICTKETAHSRKNSFLRKRCKAGNPRLRGVSNKAI